MFLVAMKPLLSAFEAVVFEVVLRVILGALQRVVGKSAVVDTLAVNLTLT